MPLSGVRSSCEVLARNSLLSWDAASSWELTSSRRRLLVSSPSANTRIWRSDSTRSLMSRTIAV